MRVTSKYSPSNPGVVLAMARSIHCRCVSSQMGSNFFNGDLKLPPLHALLQDLYWGLQAIRTERGLGREFALGITDQNPAHGKGRMAGVIPDRSLRNDLRLSLGVPISAFQAVASQRWIVNQGCRSWEAAAFQRLFAKASIIG
jgi:hypothetical protein